MNPCAKLTKAAIGIRDGRKSEKEEDTKPGEKKIDRLSPEGQQRPGDDMVIALGHHTHSDPVPLLQCARGGFLSDRDGCDIR